MRHRCRLRSETGWAEFGYFLCYFIMVAPRALVFRPLVKGTKTLGMRMQESVNESFQGVDCADIASVIFISYMIIVFIF